MPFLLLILFLAPLYSQNPRRPDIIPRFPDTSRVTVFPLFFVPSDASLSPEEAAAAQKLLFSHLKIAQEHYRFLLKTDTFIFLNPETLNQEPETLNQEPETLNQEPETLNLKPTSAITPARRPGTSYHSHNDHAWFIDAPADNNDGKPMRITKELFKWNNDDRYESNLVYLVIYKRPGGKEPKEGDPWFGGGRTFNGPPNTGGGYVEMEFSSLMNDQPYPFQSTLVHELGHAFGLTHSDYLGYDLSTNMSIMSYNTAHWSKGLSQSSDPGGLNPEELFVLSLNKRVFPQSGFDSSNPHGTPLDLEKIQQCFLGPMGTGIGEFRHFEGVGYELFFNGRRVNSPEAALYSRIQASENCAWNKENNTRVKVECRYNGISMINVQ